jgi:hypothetical protein
MRRMKNPPRGGHERGRRKRPGDLCAPHRRSTERAGHPYSAWWRVAPNVSRSVAAANASSGLNEKRGWLHQNEPHTLVHAAKKTPTRHFANFR